jgi:hypothetical protein
MLLRDYIVAYCESPLKQKNAVTILWRVTVDGLIDDRIYWNLWYSAWLHFTVHFYTHTHTLVSTVTYSLPLLGSDYNGGRYPSSGFPNSFRPQLRAYNSNSSRHLNLSGYLTAAQNLSCLQYLGTDSTENTGPLAVLLLSNDCFIDPYFEVVAQQRIYMPQYTMWAKCIARVVVVVVVECTWCF